jgi:hypothetical protein
LGAGSPRPEIIATESQNTKPRLSTEDDDSEVDELESDEEDTTRHLGADRGQAEAPPMSGVETRPLSDVESELEYI